MTGGRLFRPLAHLIGVIRKLAWVVILVAALAQYSLGSNPPLTVPRGCTGSVSLGTFRITARRSPDAPPLPLKSVSALPAGALLVWDPLHLSARVSGNGEVAALLIPQGRGAVIALEPHKAAVRAEWTLPQNAGVVALIVGPHGLSMSKVKSLMARNEDLLTQLADYAEQTSEVETLVQELADAEESGGGTDAALKGFSSQFGVSMPKLDTKANSDQQASVLLRAVLPSASNYDPLAPTSSQMQQSVGLAASVAGLFFGNGVTLAAGGTALFSNLKAVMFPGTEFRSAFAQANEGNALALCTKNSAAKSRTRIAYLWAYRVPGLKPPVVAIAGPFHLPIGSKSPLKLKVGEGSDLKELARAHDWRLIPVAGGAPIDPGITIAPPDSLELDLSKSKAQAGEYRLVAGWDWDPISLGTVWLHPYGDFSHVHLAAGASDKLLEGSGSVLVKLTGADFEFVEKVEWKKATDASAKPAELHFALPRGKRAGEQGTMEVDIDTAAHGTYRLVLAQSDGKPHEVPVTVLPPNPKVSNLPVRVNVDEAQQRIHLAGTGLDEIQTITTPAGAISGKGTKQEWTGEIQLKPGAQAGQHFPLTLQVKGLEEPLTLPDAIAVVGPRPQIAALRKSAPGNLGVDLHEDELPAGITLGLVLRVKNLHGRPQVELGCQADGLRHALKLSPDEPAGGSALSFAGPGELYLSFDPGAVGYPGCTISAAVVADPEGRSELVKLGRVVRIPRLDQFTLTSEPTGQASYAGILKGSDLDLVEKAGWDTQHGLAVDAIPTPVPGEPAKQTLRISLPWPAPAPHAPLYVWLRGEAEGRKTAVSY
ncbi:hypothetical protein SBA3_1050009 [Candidatus Sulfopaludibacter sp. SbA3]|nr:hypothetical protein SBA3_1050009 [Candidatus Sulfopaludibacter sp. SbA3]